MTEQTKSTCLIEITPEMVEAGKAAYWEWGNGPDTWDLTLGIEKIVEAALRAARPGDDPD